jgi:hypothetical protein
MVFATFNFPNFIRGLLSFEVHVAFENFEFTISSIKPHWFAKHLKIFWIVPHEVTENLFHIFGHQISVVGLSVFNIPFGNFSGENHAAFLK